MVLGGRPPGRVGRRRISPERAPVFGGSFTFWVRSRHAAPSPTIVVASAPSIIGAAEARGRGTEKLGWRRPPGCRQRAGRRAAADGVEGVARRSRPERR